MPSDNRIVEFVPRDQRRVHPGRIGHDPARLSNSVYGDQALFSQPLGIVYDSFRGGLVVVDQANQVLRL